MSTFKPLMELSRLLTIVVIPAKAGIHLLCYCRIPAYDRGDDADTASVFNGFQNRRHHFFWIGKPAFPLVARAA